MSRRVSSPSPEAKETLRALRRAARNALELGIKTGTPVYVMRNNKIVDLTRSRVHQESRSQNALQRRSDAYETQTRYLLVARSRFRQRATSNTGTSCAREVRDALWLVQQSDAWERLALRS